VTLSILLIMFHLANANSGVRVYDAALDADASAISDTLSIGVIGLSLDWWANWLAGDRKRILARWRRGRPLSRMSGSGFHRNLFWTRIDPVAGCCGLICDSLLSGVSRQV
jgi:hypothetical protein